MLNTFSFHNCIYVGMQFAHLQAALRDILNDPDRITIPAFYIKKFLEHHEFDSAIAVGTTLWHTAEGIERASSATDKLKVLHTWVPRLVGVPDAIYRALSESAVKRQLAELKIGGVSQRLRDLPKTLPLTDAQKHFLDETIRCLECEAYRAAAVMGWNLAYDYVRGWVLADSTRLAAFNSTLTNNSKYSEIVNYEDFFEQKEPPGEYVVLEACRNAHLINGKVFDKLCHYLRERNQCAHPNDSIATTNTTNAYIEYLIGIISAAPFR